MAAIAFVGDSFCAAYGLDEWKLRGCTLQQWGTDEPTDINQVGTTKSEVKGLALFISFSGAQL